MSVNLIEMKDTFVHAASDQSSRRSSHAVVIGGSLAGMLAARVLSDHFERVTVIERDSLPDGPMPRKGVPQARHLHVLLARGQLIFEQFFPGLRDEMIAAGAPVLDMAEDAAWLTPAGWGLRYASGLKLLTFTRGMLDWKVRRRLADFPNVRFLEEAETTRLLPNADDSGAGGVGVRFRHLTNGDTVPEQLHYADLVVDASGRGSRAAQWLESLGYEAPAETVINSFRGYASCFYQPPAHIGDDWKGIFIQAAPPERTRAGLLFPVEGNRWLVTLIGGGGEYPPADEAGFREFARSLASPLLYDAIKDAVPLSPVHSYRATENRLRHFEEVPRWPENFVVLGDAACAFNPVYGQGMTIAALGAMTLDGALRERRELRGGAKNLAGMARRFQKRLAKVNRAPWLLATGEDFRYRETVGGSPTLPTRMMHRYMDQVLRVSVENQSVRQRFLEIFNMLRPPSALFHPRIVWEVMKLAFRLTPITKAPTSMQRNTAGAAT